MSFLLWISIFCFCNLTEFHFSSWLWGRISSLGIVAHLIVPRQGIYYLNIHLRMRWKEYERKESETCNAIPLFPPQSCRWFVLSFPMPFVPARAPAIRKKVNWIQTGDKWNKMYKNQQAQTSKSFKLISGIWSCFLMFHPAPSHNVPSDYIQPTHLPGHMTRNPKVIGHSRQLFFQH